MAASWPSEAEERQHRSHMPERKQKDYAMSVNTSLFVIITLLVLVVFTVYIVGWAFYHGIKEHHGLIFWRFAKLLSAVFGLVGLMLLALNFEKATRDWLGGKSREYAFAEYIDLKFFIARELAVVCAHEQDNEQARLTCFDVKNVDAGIAPLHIRNSEPYTMVINWQRNKSIDEFIGNVNGYLHRINSAIPSSTSALSFVSDSLRVDILALSFVLVAISLAGSIGEAAFQYKLALKAAEADSNKQYPGCG